VETWLAWERVAGDVQSGVLGEDYDQAEIREVQGKVREAQEDARDEVWATYTIVAVADVREQDGLKVVDLGAGHASTGETLCGRILAALKAEGLLSESVGASYIERHWPPALQESGAWPLTSLRQAFLDGSLTRLVDPEAVLRAKLQEFVDRGDFGLASGPKDDGTYQRVWYREPLPPDEVAFDHDVHLLRKERAQDLKAAPVVVPPPTSRGREGPSVGPTPPVNQSDRVIIRISGDVPPELWNRLGTRLIPRLRTHRDLQARVQFECEVEQATLEAAMSGLRSVLEELGLSHKLQIEQLSLQVTSKPTIGN
jgi:hypothetical protein